MLKTRVNLYYLFFSFKPDILVNNKAMSIILYFPETLPYIMTLGPKLWIKILCNMTALTTHI